MSDTGYSSNEIEFGGVTEVTASVSRRTLDTVFEMLSSRRRRYVLYYLNDRPDEDATVCELANLVTAWERLVGTDPPTPHRRWVSTSLRTDHLPALRDAGMIEYNDDMVSYRVNDGFLRRLLSCAGITELP